MPRPRKPHWHPHSSRWRTTIDGKVRYFPVEIGRHDRPQIANVPKAAWDHLASLERETRDRTTAGSDPTVFWLLTLYLRGCAGEVAAGDMAADHVEGLEFRLRLFRDHPGIGDTKARLLTVDQAAEFFGSLKGRYSQHYVAGVGRSVRAAFRWGAKAIAGRTPPRLLAENPLAGYDFPRAPGAVRGYVEGAVVRRFFRWAWGKARRESPKALTRRFDRLFVLMLRFQRLTGCRPGEACGLLWEDVKWPDGKIVIPPERQKTGRKTGKARTIYLTPPVRRLLRVIERLEGRHPDHVFTHMRGTNAAGRGHADPVAGEPWPSGRAASAKVRRLRLDALAEGLAGLEGVGPKKLVAYSNRHGYVSDGVSSGLTHEQVAGLVGNTAAVIASTYAHAVEGAEAERARGLMDRGKSSGK